MSRDPSATPDMVEYIRNVVLSLVFDEAEEESVKRTRDSHSAGHSSPKDDDAAAAATDDHHQHSAEAPHPPLQPYPQIELNTGLIDDIVTGIRSDDATLQLSACRQLLLCPSSSSEMPLPTLLYSLLDALVDSGLVPRLLSFLTTPTPEGEDDNKETPPPTNPALVISAAWVISILAKIEPKLLVDKGAIPILLGLLRIQCPGPCIPAAYALGAIASCSGGTDKKVFANHLRDAGTIPVLMDAIDEALQEDDAMLNLPLTLALSKLAKNICYVPKNVRVTPDQLLLLKNLADICTKIPEPEIIYHCAWGIYYLTKSGNEAIIGEMVQESPIIPILVRAIISDLTTPTRRHLLPSLSVLGNVISSTVDSHTDAVLDAGLLPHLLQLILEPGWTKEANWIVSNVAAGNVMQKEDLFRAGFFAKIMQLFALAAENSETFFLGAKEAVFTIVNIMDKGSLDQKWWFLDNGILPALVTLLRQHPNEVLDPVRDSIYLLVKTFHPLSESENENISERVNLQKLLNESGALLEMSKYQEDDDEEVWDRVAYIMDVGLNNASSWYI